MRWFFGILKLVGAGSMRCQKNLQYAAFALSRCFIFYIVHSREGRAEGTHAQEGKVMQRSVARRFPLFVVLACLGIWGIQAPSLVSADSVIVPNALAGVDTAGVETGLPFNIASFLPPHTSLRFQQVYDASEFSGPIIITGLAFRPDSSFGGSFISTLPSIQINLSTTAQEPDSLSLIFSDYVGSDDTVVFNGPLSLSSDYLGSSPKDFDIEIPLTTPFTYNPALGNLLLDVRNFGGGATTFFDAAPDAVGDSVSRIASFGSLDGVNDATATLRDSIGLVTRFDFRAVPEPSTWLLLGTGVFGLLAAGWYRKKRTA
jgi:hypothetical protein